MRTVLLAMILALGAVASASNAQMPPPVKGPVKAVKVDTCTNLKNSAERVACLSPKLEQATASLNATYAAIKSHFGTDTANIALFDASHDTWLKTMAQTCEAAEQFYNGGNIAPAIGVECRLTMTVDRERLLKALYHAPLNN